LDAIKMLVQLIEIVFHAAEMCSNDTTTFSLRFHEVGSALEASC
jgi:hypothetical protein